MSTRVEYAPPAGCRAAWDALVEDTGVNVVVCDSSGSVLFANERARRWFRWRSEEEREGVGAQLCDDETCAASFLEERSRLVREVCVAGRAITYESICRDIRYRITMRPIPHAEGEGHDALITSRRMQPWERVEMDDRADPATVEITHHEHGMLSSLSRREMDVMVLIAEGLSYAQIAERLNRSIRTIERHRDRLGQKLGARNRVEIARFAIRAGLSELPDEADAHLLKGLDHDPLRFSEPVSRIASRRARSEE